MLSAASRSKWFRERTECSAGNCRRRWCASREEVWALSQRDRIMRSLSAAVSLGAVAVEDGLLCWRTAASRARVAADAMPTVHPSPNPCLRRSLEYHSRGSSFRLVPLLTSRVDPWKWTVPTKVAVNRPRRENLASVPFRTCRAKSFPRRRGRSRIQMSARTRPGVYISALKGEGHQPPLRVACLPS